MRTRDKAYICLTLFLLLLALGWALDARLAKSKPSAEGRYTIRSVGTTQTVPGGIEPFGAREYIRIIGWEDD